MPLPAYGAMARSRQAPLASESSTMILGQGEADPLLLHHRLWVARLVLLGVRHGDVRAVDDEDASPVPQPRLGEALL